MQCIPLKGLKALSTLNTLCVSSAASFSQLATSLSCANTFFGSFCNDDGVHDDGGGGDGGGDDDVDDLHDEASRGVYKWFPNGPSHQEDKKA